MVGPGPKGEGRAVTKIAIKRALVSVYDKTGLTGLAAIPLAFGSDGPLNPYLNIMLACRDPDRPTESVSREQAVIEYTQEAAYAEFTEKDKGTLEPGKLADLAVLSQDIFAVPLERLPQTTAVLTIVGGRTAYDGGMLVER